jgi:ankyrin repeat protein
MAREIILWRHPIWIPMRVVDRHVRSGLLLVACTIAVPVALAREPAVQSPACRELGRRVDLMAADAGALELNAALFQASDAGCIPLARHLVDAGASLAARDRFGAAALAHAARAGHTALVELFLAQGATIDARNLAGATALLAAAENGQQPTVALLLAKGADPNLPGRSDVTPLAAAAFRGNDGATAELIAHGAKPDAMDATGKTPIVYAAARGFTPLVRRLLAAGVDARRAYGNDLTALMWVAGYEDVYGERDALDVVALLLDAGAPIDAAVNRGRTALMIAAERGHAAVVEALLARGADRAIRDRAGKRALDLASNVDVRATLSAR